MSELIPPSRQASAEALALSSEILRNIELSELSLTNIALKTGRLARLLNDFDMQRIVEYEIGGYPTTPSGVRQDVWKLAVDAGRKFVEADKITKAPKDFIYLDSIGALEEQIRTTEAALAAAREPENPNPTRKVGSIELPSSSSIERSLRLGASQKAAQRLASRRASLYQYVLRKHYELKFSDIADDVFNRIRERVDNTIGTTIPDAVKRFSAVYENLRSENSEDWSNAVHGCRRILQDLADSVFPPTDQIRVVKVGGKEQQIKLGRENYTNRIIAFIGDKAESDRFQEIVGSHLSFIGNRLDSIVEAANKGTHDTIVSREEADRYVVYTYLLVGDILSLLE